MPDLGLFMIKFYISFVLPEASFGLQVLSSPASVPMCLCVCASGCVNHLLVRVITRDQFKLGLPNLDQRCKRPSSRSLLFFRAIDYDLQGQIQLKSIIYPHFELVLTLTHYPFKLGSPNLNQRWEIACLRTLLFWVTIDPDLHGQIWFKILNVLVSPLLEKHNHHITTTYPWVPRLLHRPDCFMVSIPCEYLYT